MTDDLIARLKLHAYELTNGGANASQLRADLFAAAEALAAASRPSREQEMPACGGSGMTAYWDGSAMAGEMCRGCKDCEPNVEALIVQASAWQAQFFDDEVRKWAFTAREIEARQIIADLMLCILAPPAASASPAAPPPWQPIETAPKDGTRILVAWPNSAVQESYFSQMSNRWNHNAPVAPTHWLPLPSPPASAPQPEEK